MVMPTATVRSLLAQPRHLRRAASAATRWPFAQTYHHLRRSPAASCLASSAVWRRGYASAVSSHGRQPSSSSSSHKGETLDEELKRLAGYAQTSVSLKATLDTGLGLLLSKQADVCDDSGLTRRQRTLIQIATFLKRELPVRLARRVVELNALPEGLHAMPSVKRVREWYEHSFVEIRRAAAPNDVEREEGFYELMTQIYDRHAPTLVTMARGVHELRQELVKRNGADFEFGDVKQVSSRVTPCLTYYLQMHTQ